MTPETRPLRIAYVRLSQAVLALRLEGVVDESGMNLELDNIVKSVNTARSNIERLAAANGIDLFGDA